MTKKALINLLHNSINSGVIEIMYPVNNGSKVKIKKDEFEALLKLLESLE